MVTNADIEKLRLELVNARLALEAGTVRTTVGAEIAPTHLYTAHVKAMYDAYDALPKPVRRLCDTLNLDIEQMCEMIQRKTLGELLQTINNQKGRLVPPVVDTRQPKD